MPWFFCSGPNCVVEQLWKSQLQHYHFHEKTINKHHRLAYIGQTCFWGRVSWGKYLPSVFDCHVCCGRHLVPIATDCEAKYTGDVVELANGTGNLLLVVS